MRVVFINPATPRFFEPRMQPMLGMLYVAAALRDAGAEVMVWDRNLFKEPPVDEADIVMVTATTPAYMDGVEARRRVKAGYAVVGGAHATAMGAECLKDFDAVVVGEGEMVAPTLLGRMSGVLRWTAPVDVDRLSEPAYDLWPELAQSSIVKVAGVRDGLGTSIITSRGCPFRCAFCAAEHGKVRFRSLGKVFREVDRLRRVFGITQLRIYDDVANSDGDRFKKLCDGLAKRCIVWRVHTRSDYVTPEVCRLMKDSGCVEVGLGVESGSDRMLRLMNKAECVSDHEKAIGYLRDAGIESRVYLIVGFPGESWESVEETEKFLRRARPGRAVVNTFAPYPGSDVWVRPEKYRCRINPRFEEYWQVGLEEDEGFWCEIEGMGRDELRVARKRLQGVCAEFGSTDRRVA